MYAKELYPVIGRADYGIAATLEQIMFHYRRHNGTQPFRLNFITRFIKRSVSAISRYIKWLEEQGFIQVRRVRWGTATTLYIRPLVRVRGGVQTTPGKERENRNNGTADGTAMKSDGTAMGRYTQGDTKENTQGHTLGHTPSAPPEIGDASVASSGSDDTPAPRKRGLKHSLKDVEDRLKEKQGHARARTRGEPPTPRKIALIWNRILSEYGYPRFDPDAPKHLSAIKKTIKDWGLATIEAMEWEIERRVGLWQNTRPDRLRKTPPHPWAINRTWALYASLEEEPDATDELTFTEIPQDYPSQIYEADKPEDSVVPSKQISPMDLLKKALKSKDAK